MTSFYQKNNYDVQITIGTLLLTTLLGKNENGLCDELNISATCGNARTAVFSFIPPENTIDLTLYEGKAVQIMLRTPTDGWQTVFTGIVDTPRINFISRKITLECSDNRQNRIIKLPLGVVSSIGSYSDTVFGVSTDRADELTKRLQTVTADFDFDRFGNYALTSWTPKATADYTLVPSDISREQDPTIDYNASSKSINTINITVNYTYPRLHQQHVNVNWPGYANFISDWFTAGKPSFLSRDTAITAANAGNWRVIGDITFTALWPAQGFSYGGGVIIWQPNTVEQQTVQRQTNNGYLKNTDGSFVLDSNGQKVKSYTPVFDNQNKPVMDVVSSTVTDTSSGLCRGANWVAATRFTQTVTEKYTIKLQAPQVIARYGVIDSAETISIQSPYDDSDWESGKEISNTNQNFYINQKPNANKIMESIGVALNKAAASIKALYRNYTFSFRTKLLKPKIDVWNTLDVTVNEAARGATSSIHAKGKVDSLTHYVNFNTLEAYSTVTLKLSRSEGSATDSTWVIPSPAENPGYIYNTLRSITLQTYIAQDPEFGALNAQFQRGWFCNGAIRDANNNTVRTTYPEYLSFDYPQIPDSIRKEITYTSNSVFNIAIPNDTLIVSF